MSTTGSNTGNNTPKGGTSRTETEVCKRAYESTNPLARYDPDDDPDNPKSPLYDLERYWLDEDTDKRFEVFSKNVLQRYLDFSDPFQLKKIPGMKLTKTKLEQAMNCVWKKYYAQLERGTNQKLIDRLRENEPNEQNNFNKYFDVRRGYVDQLSLKSTFEKFIKEVLESSNLDVTNDSVSEECSTFMNPTDVFSPCTENCIDLSRSGANKNLTQPRLMQVELTKFQNTLTDMHTHLIIKLEETKLEMKKELEEKKVHPKRIKDILDNKFGAITTVPDVSEKSESKIKLNYVKAMNMSLNQELQKTQNKRNKEAEKKRRQKLQNKLIKTVIDDKGRLDSKYNNLFALETPFDLSDKGKVISKDTGVLKTKYDRSNKRVELQLRFKANQALSNAQDALNKKLKEGKFNSVLSEKAKLLKELSNKPHADKPLKLVRTGTKTTVARGGDKALRKLIALFGIQEFKDKLNGMKQKYALTEKTEKILDYPKGIFSLRAKDQNHPIVGDFKYFLFKDLEKTVEKIFLDYLYVKLRDIQVDTFLDIGQLKTYEKIDIPYVDTYKLDYSGTIFMFARDKSGTLKMKFKQFANNLTKNSINLMNGNSSSKSLKYKMNVKGPFVNYEEAVRLARKMIRSKPDTMHNDALARFYLRNDDRYRMEPIGNILKLVDLHKNAKAKASSKGSPKRVSPSTPVKKITYRPSTPPPKKRSAGRSAGKMQSRSELNRIANILLAKSPSRSATSPPPKTRAPSRDGNLTSLDRDFLRLTSM